MKIRYFLLCLLPFFPINPVAAQADLPKYAGVDAGICIISARMQDMDFIRGNIPAYPGGYASSYLRSFMNRAYAGVKGEYLLKNRRFGFSTGVRYVQTNALLGRNTYWTGNSGYFYLMYREEGLTTEYAKVKEIVQTTAYLGIPLEARFFPYNARLFRVYFKLAADVDFRLQSLTDIVFYNSSMEYLEDEVSVLIGTPESVAASVTISAGVRIGREGRPAFSLEAGLPSMFVESGSAGLLNPVYGGGFQVSFQWPIKSLQQ